MEHQSLPKPGENSAKMLEGSPSLGDIVYSQLTMHYRTGMPKYKYQPLSQPDSFRLLIVVPAKSSPHGFLVSLRQCSLNDNLKFCALSYTWDLPEHKPGVSPGRGQSFDIICDGAIVTVTENLFEFLVGVAWGAPIKPFWIDALCVDQSNLDERSKQVMLMNRIYGDAENVLVWLGKTKAPDEVAWVMDEFIPKVREAGNRANKDPFCVSPGMVEALGEDMCARWRDSWITFFDFFDRQRWFSRGWIVQEVALNSLHKVIMVSGTERSQVLKWDKLTYFGYFLNSMEWKRELTRIRLRERNYDTEEIIEVGQQFRRITEFQLEIELDQNYSEDIRDWLRTIYGAELDEEIWYARASIQVNKMRFSQFTDDRDHVYGCLGLISYMLPEFMTNPVIPDYRSTVEDVFTATASLFIEKLPILRELSRVEDKKYRRYLSLPSWVPDYSVGGRKRPLMVRSDGPFRDNDGTLLGLRGSSFDASLTTKSKPQKPVIQGRALAIYGARFDIVRDPGTTTLETPRALFHDLLHLCMKGGLVYEPTGQPRIEAVWRTAIADEIDLAPAPSSLSLNFRECFLIIFAQMILPDVQTAKPLRSPILTCEAAPLITENPEYSEWIPSLQETVEFVREIGSCAGDTEDQLEQKLERNELFQLMAPSFLHRRMYCTTDGYLGLGPESLTDGDEVWLVEGAKVLFILRKTAESGSYTLVGETYVHGFMHGEIMTPELRSRIDLVKLV